MNLEALIETYKQRGKASLKAYGVHHLSSSSVAHSLMDCSKKFVFKGLYTTPKVTLIMGTVFHEIVEDISHGIFKICPGITNGTMDLDEISNVYPDARDRVLSNYALDFHILNKAELKYEEEVNSTRQLLMEGSLSQFRSELMNVAETASKSVTLDDIKQLMEYPVLFSEFKIYYFPPEGIIPYIGFIDQIIIKDGQLVIGDLKTGFSKSPYIWSSWTTLFQLWLYSKALKQMGILDKVPETEIVRMIVNTKTNIKKGKYEVIHERKTVNNIEQYDEQFNNVIKMAENMIKHNIDLCGTPTFGCKACDYFSVCDSFIVPEWKDVEKPKTEEVEADGN